MLYPLPADLTCKLNMNADSGHWQLYLKTAVLHIGIRALHGHCNKEKSWLRPCMQYSRFFFNSLITQLKSFNGFHNENIPKPRKKKLFEMFKTLQCQTF